MKTRRFLSFFSAFLLIWILTVPTLAADAEKVLEDPAVQAESVLLVERTSGKILYSVNADTQRYPSSLVKIMTALLVLEAVEESA